VAAKISQRSHSFFKKEFFSRKDKDPMDITDETISEYRIIEGCFQ